MKGRRHAVTRIRRTVIKIITMTAREATLWRTVMGQSQSVREVDNGF